MYIEHIEIKHQIYAINNQIVNYHTLSVRLTGTSRCYPVWLGNIRSFPYICVIQCKGSLTIVADFSPEFNIQFRWRSGTPDKKSPCISIIWSILSFQTGPEIVWGHALALLTALQKKRGIFIQKVIYARKLNILPQNWLILDLFSLIS